MENIKRNVAISLTILLCAFGPRKPIVKTPTPDNFYPCSEEVFWHAVCMAESGCNPKSVYMEPPPLRYESLGLYQTSPEDSRVYPECSPNRADHLTVEGGTRCKDGIVKKLRSSYPSLSYQLALGKYWSVLRGPEWGSRQRSGFARFKSYVLKMGCVL